MMKSDEMKKWRNDDEIDENGRNDDENGRNDDEKRRWKKSVLYGVF